MRPTPHPITRRDLDRLAIPAIISGIAEPLIALVDMAYVGKLGDDDLAAVGIGSSFFLLVVWVLAQTRSAVLAVVARYYGEQRLEEVRWLVPLAVWMNFGLGLLFFGITNAFSTEIFQLYNAHGPVLEKTVAYFHIRSFGYPFVLATFAMTGAFRGIQNLSWSMWISLIGATVNLALNPLLIFGYGGFPQLGIEGSSWASLTAQLTMFTVAIVVLRTRTPFPLFPKKWRHPELGSLWLLSGNLFARTIALNACYYLGARYAAGYSMLHSAAHSIAMNIWLFSAFFIDGYAAAGSVLVGRFNGERNWEALYRVSWQVVRRSILIGGILAAVYGIGYLWIGGFFTKGPETLALFNAVFWLVVISQPINAVAFAFDGIYKGVGDGKSLRNVLIIATFGVFLPAAWAMDALGWQLHAVWAAFLLWMLTRGLMLSLAFEKEFGPRSALRRPSLE
ncbi:MAG: MATE family efflux transporter [Flavobacteriales bacterium]